MTTLNQIRSHGPCQDGWTKLLAHLGKTKADDEPLSLLTVLRSNGLDDAIWCLRTEPTPERIQRFVLACARRVEHLHPEAKACNDVAERYLAGTATQAELNAAASAASAATYAAASAASAASAATYAAASAASAATYAAARAAASATSAATYAAARAAASAANAAARAAAASAAAAAAYAAANADHSAEREAQTQIFMEIFA